MLQPDGSIMCAQSKKSHIPFGRLLKNSVDSQNLKVRFEKESDSDQTRQQSERSLSRQ